MIHLRNPGFLRSVMAHFKAALKLRLACRTGLARATSSTHYASAIGARTASGTATPGHDVSVASAHL